MSALPQPPLSDRPLLRTVPKQSSSPRNRWKRILLWIAGGILALIVLLVVASYVLLHSRRFHAYLLRTVQAKASQSLGSQVRFRDFALSWAGISPTVDLYDIVVNGAPPYQSPALLRADSLRVGITISSLLHRSWYVNDLALAHPVVHIFTDQHGQSNLPRSSNKSSQSSLDIFQLGIRNASIRQGEVYYNNRKANLDADLHDLAVHIGFAPTQQKYSGTISYRDGIVRLQPNRTLPHQLDARFSLTKSQFSLESATLTSGRSQIHLQATVTNFSQPDVQARYSATLNASDLSAELNNSNLPEGTISLTGEMTYHDVPDRSMVENATVRGEVHSAALTLTQQGKSVRIGNFSAGYSLVSGDARVTDLKGNLLGGQIAGHAEIRDLANSARGSLKASLRSVSVSAIQSLASPDTRSKVQLSGTITAAVNSSWNGSLKNLAADGRLHVAAAMQPANESKKIPLNGNIHARYDGERQVLEVLGASSVRTPNSTLSLNGAIGKESAMQVRLETGDLHEFEQLANAFRSSDASPLNLHGRAVLSASISGRTSDPRIRGQLTATDVRVHNSAWKSLQAQFAASSRSASLDQVELIPAGRGKITMAASTELQKWALTPSSQFHARLNASDLDAKQLAGLAGSTTPVSGALSVHAEVQGTQLAPVGKGTLQLKNAEIGGEAINLITAGFNADGNTINTRTQVTLPAGSLNADISYQPRQQQYDLALRSGGIKLQDLKTVQAKNMQLTGILAVEASGHGTLKDPGLQATVSVPTLGIRNQTINNIRLKTGIENHVAKFTLDSEAMGIHAGSQGTIQLTGNYLADITANTQPLQLQPLVAMYAPAQAADVSGQTEIHASLHGPLKQLDQIEAHVVIPQLSVNYKNSIKLAATGPIRADYVRGTLDVKRSSIRGTGTNLTFQASIPRAKDASVSILLEGNVDLALAQMFSPDVTSGGQLRFDINSYGQRSDPTIQGQVRIVNASFAQAGTPLGLNNGNGTLTLTRDRLNVTEFKGQVGGGTVTASGGVVYRPQLRADLAMKAEGVRILYEQSVRATINSDLALVGDYDNAMLRGQVSVEQLAFTPNFDLVSFSEQFGGGDTLPPPRGGFSENLHLNISLETPGGLNLSSRDLTLAGSAALRLQGTAAQPVLLGRVNLTDGDLIFYGNRYLVQRGTIDFRNPTRTEPVVDMSINTTIQQYDIQMHIWGPADHLATNYSSVPALPPSDIINLIAFGKTAEAKAANPSPPGMLGAQSLVASQVSSQVTSRVSKLAGISQLSVDPVLGSGQQSGGARVTIQQHVTGKLFVTFSTDVTSTQQQVVQVEYRMNRRTSFKGLRDQNGGFSFQTTFKKEW